MTFEKGTLLNLALKNMNEFDDLKSNVDDALKYYIKNVKYKIGEAQVINNKNTSDILVNVDMWLENKDEYIDLLKNFTENINNNYIDENRIGLWSDNYRGGAKKDELKNYNDYNCRPRLKIKAGKYYTFESLYGFVSPYTCIYFKQSWQVTIPRIPTVELSSIGSIDAEVVCEYGVNKKTKEKVRKRNK